MAPLETRKATQSPSVEPLEALRRAVASLEQGAAEPRTLEGAKVHALESIAWSLAGLLADKLPAEHQPTRPRTVQQVPTSLTGELRGIFGINEPRP